MSNTNKGKELYTQEEQIWATQLVYCNFKDDDESDVGKTVQEIILERGPGIYYNYNSDSTPSGDKKEMKESTVKPQIISGDFCRLFKAEIPVTVCGQ